jgi:hypothetical protein
MIDHIDHMSCQYSGRPSTFFLDTHDPICSVDDHHRDSFRCVGSFGRNACQILKTGEGGPRTTMERCIFEAANVFIIRPARRPYSS